MVTISVNINVAAVQNCGVTNDFNLMDISNVESVQYPLLIYIFFQN
jgi:hypothetical protein